jgi:hypothetical protein
VAQVQIRVTGNFSVLPEETPENGPPSPSPPIGNVKVSAPSTTDMMPMKNGEEKKRIIPFPLLVPPRLENQSTIHLVFEVR